MPDTALRLRNSTKSTTARGSAKQSSCELRQEQITQAVEDNPDLAREFIEGIFCSMDEHDEGKVSEYKFG
jgi:hypothetical protein